MLSRVLSSSNYISRQFGGADMCAYAEMSACTKDTGGGFLHKSFSTTSETSSPTVWFLVKVQLFGACACASLADDEQNVAQAGRGTQQYLAYPK